MALTIADRIKHINPDIGVILNLDGVTYRLGVEDVNSDEILVATQASAVDLAAIETINTAIRTAVQGMQAVNGAVGVAADIDGVRQGQLRYIGDRLEAIENAVEAQGEGDYATPTHTWPAIAAATTVALAANANRLYACFFVQIINTY